MPRLTLKTTLYSCCPRPLRPYWDRVEASEIGYRLARGAFWTLAGAFISRGAMLLAFMLIARMLGKEGFGELGIVRSTVGMFGTLAGFGLGMTATKHVAEFRRSDPGRAGRIMALSSLAALATGGLMMAVLLVLAPWLAAHTLKAAHLAGLLRLGGLLLLLNTLNGTQTGSLAGLEAFKTIARVNLLVGLACLPILAVGTYAGGLSGAVWGLTLTLALNWGLNHLALRREAARTGIPFRMAGCMRDWAVLWQFSLPMAITSTMVGPVNWIAKAMLVNQPGGYASLGIFEAADQWRTLVLYPPALIASSCLPVLSQLYAEGQRQQFKKALSSQFVVTAAMTAVAAGLVACFGRPIMSCYGEGFSGHVLVLVVIMITAVIVQLERVAGLVNQSIGAMWWGVLLNSSWAAIFLVLAGRMVRDGALGLAMATLWSYIAFFAFGALYVAYVFRRYPKLNGQAAA